LLSKDELTQTLLNLGLTVLQAKVYLALDRVGAATGRATAKEANIAPADIYRVLSELYEKGLIEKILAKPNRHRAIPIKQGISILLERRENQTSELKKIMLKVTERDLILDKQGSTGKDLFILEPAKEAFIRKVDNLFETAQTRIDLMANFEEAMRGHEALVDLEIKKLKSGVKIREILSKSQKCTIPKCFLKLLKRRPSYQVRYLDCPEPANVLIKDGKEVFISTENNVRIIDQPHLCSNNPTLVRIVQEWFDNLWEKANEE
jgi:sugar-specific transcriptional regulator TrmB